MATEIKEYLYGLVLRLRALGFSLDNTGTIIGMDRYKARQIEARAMRKLKDTNPKEYEVYVNLRNQSDKEPIMNKFAYAKHNEHTYLLGKIDAYKECGLKNKEIANKIGIKEYRLYEYLHEIKALKQES